MLAPERRQEIFSILKNKKNITVKDLAKTFKVTMETIRADLDTLCKENNGVKRVHGGVYLIDSFNTVIPMDLREKVMIEEKQRLGQTSLSLVKNGDVIMLDSSSTAEFIARELIKMDIAVVVITNSIVIMNICIKSLKIKLISIGGNYSSYHKSFNGNLAQEALSNYHSDFAFISPTAISSNFGLSDDDQYEAEIRKLMIKNCSFTTLVVDYTKFNQTKLTKICDYRDIRCVVTDKKPSKEWLDLFKQYNIKLLVC